MKKVFAAIGTPFITAAAARTPALADDDVSQFFKSNGRRPVLFRTNERRIAATPACRLTVRGVACI
ncbi:hypothetical protein PV773_24945 [Mesorhizobium sp. CC13]|uniref:hypothetical protein n=1 Tax=Mesorhizobium sp. CC13 TaxID=3029194 RepID=UPI0032642F06